MDSLERWIAQLAAEVGVSAPADVTDLLDVTRDVAHNVARPAAPLTLYVLGLAVGAGADPADVVARTSALVERWQGEASS